ncbi:MAG: flagellum-specific ATP synthase FliI [Bdellovibrionales bacterium RIFCSPHIGHO2_01_FULL_40_29]|nr:MAG: flagellum-specific ATP synthase FliI [Bdellovibrionales bacterium RIFCSPHIGHO2_01_FULL_40_29]OFZ32870.1 MAG: flagellum-specific ATP synthase FliI [Bdellovibrionales bacterium RIFCSPHIGHO2_02_FULL_40_15]
MELDLSKYYNILNNTHLTKDSGKVTDVTGLLIKGYIPGVSVGSICEIQGSQMNKSILAEVVGFKDKQVLMMSLSDMRGISMGSKITLSKSVATVRVSEELLGRVVDGLAQPLDGKPELEMIKEVPLYAEIVNPLNRKPIRQSLDVGVRAINSTLTVGRGQRVAIMAGSGVGKSVLMGMMAQQTEADVNVIALIGERGREVREFIENELGPEGMKKTVVVCVTSDQSPLLRMRGAYVATAIAEYFSGQGKNVLLVMDSVTRFAMALREIGLSIGEPPSTRGYTPSVFSTLPKLLERAGNFENSGSITGFYTTLVESDDMNDPIGDAVRSIVDGHIVLSRDLAHKGHFPAIDILQSASRVMKAVSAPEHARNAMKLREILAIYKESEDLINIGAYKAGANPKIDKAIKSIDAINDFLKQRTDDRSNMNQCLKQLMQITAGL